MEIAILIGLMAFAGMLVSAYWLGRRDAKQEFEQKYCHLIEPSTPTDFNDADWWKNGEEEPSFETIWGTVREESAGD